MQPNPRHTTTSPEPPLFQPRRLVVGWDGSEDALAALDWAAGMGARSGLPLTVLTVGDPGPQLPWRDGASPTQVSDQLRDHGAQQALAEASAAAERLRGRHPELTVTPRGEVGGTA
ncbi:MAG: universal stress protein, partial [Luteococcus japonicus]